MVTADSKPFLVIGKPPLYYVIRNTYKRIDPVYIMLGTVYRKFARRTLGYSPGIELASILKEQAYITSIVCSSCLINNTC